MAYKVVEDGDIIDPIKEGKISMHHATDILFSSREYEGTDRYTMKTRRLILEYAKNFEKELIEEYFNHTVMRDSQLNNESEEIKVDEKPDKNISRLTQFGFDNTRPGTAGTKSKYEKLKRISERISPFRIYEVPEEWNDKKDGNP